MSNLKAGYDYSFSLEYPPPITMVNIKTRCNENEKELLLSIKDFLLKLRAEECFIKLIGRVRLQFQYSVSSS